MVFQVKPTPTRCPTNSLYTTMDNTPLHSISSMCHAWGGVAVVVEASVPGAYWRVTFAIFWTGQTVSGPVSAPRMRDHANA